MNKFSIFAALSLLFAVSTMQAQVRFLDPMFGVSAAETVTYANNFSEQFQVNVDLTADVYQPVDDELELRPVVVLYHTGNFLPQYFNGSAYGGKNDSVNIEILTRLVKRGYVGMSATYRSGWQPTAGPSVRTGTLLRAVYRASQDAHAMARYLRKTVVEEGNPFRIDTSRIVFYGVGSGGYLVQAHNFLDNVDQIAQNPQFYDNNGELLIQEDTISNPEGTVAGVEHVVNHPGYSSDVALTVNLGGALGDSLWIDGADNEAPFFATHSATDPFAPYYYGLVTVPVTPPLPVVRVPGSRLAVQLSNERGVNDVLAPANAFPLPAMFGQTATVLNGTVNAYKNFQYMNPVPGSSTDVFPLGVDNLWTVLRTGPNAGSLGVTGSVWNWFSEPVLRGTIAQVNMLPGVNLDVDRIIAGEPLTNPNYNRPERAKAEIDTIMAHFYPRAWYALDLDQIVSTEEVINANQIGFSVAPNPASDYLMVSTDEQHVIRDLSVYDINGRQVRQVLSINNAQYRLERGTLPKGAYVLRIRTDSGVAARKVILE